MHPPANYLAVFKLNLQIELKLVSTTFNFSKSTKENQRRAKN